MSSNSWMSGIKPLIPKYKTETIKIPRPNLPSRTSSNNNLRNGGGQKVADACSSEVTVSRSAPVTEKKRKQKEISSSHSPRKDAVSKPRRSPSHQPLESDSDEEEETAIPAKKVRPEKLEPDFKRRLKNQKAYSTEAAESRESTRMIHAADVMMTKRRESRCESIRDRRNEEGDDVFLRYPSINRKERYQLISEGDVIDPLEEELINPYDEIHAIAEIVKGEYLTEEQAAVFGHEETDIVRKLDKARNHITTTLRNKNKKSYDKAKLKDFLLEFRNAVGDYNDALSILTKNGSLEKNLDNKHSLSSKLLEMVLKQVYDRAVSPDVDSLSNYVNGTDYVYGELNFPFISRIFKEDTNMKSDQVFVDLGSGVGNVVIHAALQIGCESWGCEIMPNCNKLASFQETEFLARCEAWGLKPGPVHLEKGDFLKNPKILEVIRKADVVLVNNQVFNPDLNQSLVDLFLDLKEGCKIVSLKTFVPDGHVINHYNQHNPINLLQVEKKEFASGDVSWQAGGGNYYVATKDSSIVASYHKSLEERSTRGSRSR